MVSFFRPNQRPLSRTEKVLLESIHFIEALFAYCANQSTENLIQLRDINKKLTCLLKESNNPKEPLFIPSIIAKLYRLMPLKLAFEIPENLFFLGFISSFEIGLFASMIGMLTLNPFTPLIMLAASACVGVNLSSFLAFSFLRETVESIGRYLEQRQFAPQTNAADLNLSEMKQRRPL